MKLLLLILGSIFLTTPSLAGEYKCHAFCGTPLILADMNILNSSQIPHTFSSGTSIEDAFSKLTKACEKAGPKSNFVPLRFLHAPTSANNQVKIVLVPALSGDVCIPVY